MSTQKSGFDFLNKIVTAGGTLDIGRGLPGMKPLWARKIDGYSALSDKEQEAFRQDQIRRGFATAGSSSDTFSGLYKDQQFIDTFGFDAFKKFNRRSRNEMLRHRILLDEYDRLYDCYKRDENGKILLDDNGNPIVDPTKGMGNADEYEKYRLMSPDGLEELVSSDFLTKPQRDKIVENREKMKEESIHTVAESVGKQWEKARETGNLLDIFVASGGMQGYSKTIEGQYNVANALSEGVGDAKREASNNALIEGIYARDNARQSQRYAPLAKQLLDELDKIPDEEIKKRFFEEITPSDTNPGNPALLAHFQANMDESKKNQDEEEMRSNEVKHFSVDDMRKYLAEATAAKTYYHQIKNPQGAFDAMHFWAKDYLDQHESWWDATRRHGNEIRIAIMNYGTSILRGWENAAAMTDKNQYIVYQDNNGEVAETKNVKYGTDKDGDLKDQYYVTDEDGNKKVVHRVTMSKSQLLQLGKDTEGVDKPWYLNNRLATDYQRFNTTDDEKVKRARKLGASSWESIYQPGSESGVLWETAKMAAFPIMDTIMMLIPGGVGAAGKGLTAMGKVGSLMNITGRALTGISKFGSKVAVPVSSAVGIGHDYGTGVFGEAYQANMTALEEKAHEIGVNNFRNDYKNNAKYKAQVDQRILQVASELEQESPELSDGRSKEQATEIVKNEEIDRYIEKYKNEDPDGEYSKGLQEAVASAAYGANTAFITDAIKYAGVNMFGYRSFLFRSPQSLAKSHLGRFYKAIKEENGRAILSKSFKKLPAAARAAKSQFIGGAWTNFTDEMQAEGGRAINEDRFAAYLNNEYDGEAAVQAYSAINSYFTGAIRALNKEHTWKAGLVGGLGSVINITPNIGRTIEHLATPSGRQTLKALWSKVGADGKPKNRQYGEIANIFFNNGIMNNYYAQKAAYNNASQTVKLVNDLLDNKKDFDALVQSLAVNTAEMDATNPTDANVMKFLNAVSAIQVLEGMKNGGKGRDKIFDAIALKMTSVQDGLNLIDRIARGDFTMENAQEYIQSYYDANPGMAKSAENDQVALDNVIKNAQYLNKVRSKIQEATRIVNNHERIFETKYDPMVKNALITKIATQDFIENTQGNNEEVLTGSRQIASSSTPTIQSWGTIEARGKAVKNLNKRISRVEKYVTAAEEAVKEKEQALENFEESRGIKDSSDLSKLSKTDQEKYKALLAEHSNAKIELGFQQQSLAELSELSKFLTDHEKDTPQVLKASEILRLPPSERARMLDEDNAKNYSKNQLVEIEKAKRELIDRGVRNKKAQEGKESKKSQEELESEVAEDVLGLVQEQARLSRYIEANKKIYTTMLRSPEAALMQLQASHEASIRAATAGLKEKQIQALEVTVRELSKLPDVSRDALALNVLNEFRMMNPEILEGVLDKDPEEVPTLSNFRAEIMKALDFSRTMDNIGTALGLMKLGKDEAKKLADNIDAIIANRGAQTRAEVLDELHTVAEDTSSRVSEADRAKFKTLLEKLQGVESLDSATRVRTKEQQEASETSSIKELAEQERKTREAINSATRQAAEEKAAKAAEELSKAAAIQGAKDRADAAISPYRKGQFSASVTRGKDGTITTKFSRYRATSHGGFRKVGRGVPISAKSVEGMAEGTNVELTTLREKDGKYEGTVKVKEGDTWEDRNVTFKHNPIEQRSTAEQAKAKAEQTAQPAQPATKEASEAENPNRTRALEKVDKEINEAQKKVDKERTDNKNYYVLEEDGKYHPYSRVHTVLGDNWIQSESETKVVEKIREKLKESLEKVDKYNKVLKEFEEKWGLDLSPFYDKATNKNIEEVITIIRDKMNGTKSYRALKTGTAVDSIIRQFFTLQDPSTISRPELLSEKAFNSLMERLKQIKTSIDKNHMTFFANNLVLYHKYSDGTRIAGEVDILAVDKDGNFRIYDVKTSAWPFGKFTDARGYKRNYFETKGTSQRMSNKEYYTQQLSAYKNLFEAQFGEPVVDLGIIPFVLSYDSSNKVVDLDAALLIRVPYDKTTPVPAEGEVTPHEEVKQAEVAPSAPETQAPVPEEPTPLAEPKEAPEAPVEEETQPSTPEELAPAPKQPETNPEAKLTDEDIAAGLEEGEEINLDDINMIESPTLEEQIADVPEGETKPVIVPVEQFKTVAELNEVPESAPGENNALVAVKFPGYDIDVLNKKGKQTLPQPKNPGDKMDQVLTWLRNEGIQYQEIVDHELGKILAMNPQVKVHFVRVTPRKNATNDNYMDKRALLAVEYTDKVAKVHKESRGGVITASNGKSYLVFGVLGAVDKNRIQREQYENFMDKLKPRAWGFFSHHPGERFWVDPNSYTHVLMLSNGVVVNQLLNDPDPVGDTPTLRTISELLYNEDGSFNDDRNPEHYHLSELSWGIQHEKYCALIGVPDKSSIDFVKDVPSNIGSVYLFAPTANGRLMPLVVRPARLQEINKGELLNEITELIGKLVSSSFDERFKAKEDLCNRIVMSAKRGLDIRYTGHNIEVWNMGVVSRAFDYTSPTFSITDLISEIFSVNPRINVTAAVLSNPTTTKMYDKAGALLTDVAKLGTSNAKCLVYTIDKDGKPVGDKLLEAKTTNDYSTDLEIYNRKLTQSEDIGGVVYRKNPSGEWCREDTGEKITDPALLKQIEYNNMIRANKMKPDHVAKSKAGPVTEYYVLSDDPNNPRVLARVPSTKEAFLLPTNQAKATVDFLRKLAEQRAQEEAIKKAALEGEDVLLDEEPAPKQPTKQEQEPSPEEPLTEEQLLAQSMGEFDTDQFTDIDQLLGQFAPSATPTNNAPKPKTPAPSKQESPSQSPITANDIVINGGLGKITPKMMAGSETHYYKNAELAKKVKDPRAVAAAQNLPTNTPSFVGNILYVPENIGQSNLFRGSGREDWESITFPRNLTPQEQRAVINVITTTKVLSWGELVNQIIDALNGKAPAEVEAPVKSQPEEAKPKTANDVLEEMKEVLIQETIKMYQEIGTPLTNDQIFNMRAMTYSDNVSTGFGAQAISDPQIKAKVDAVRAKYKNQTTPAPKPAASPKPAITASQVTNEGGVTAEQVLRNGNAESRRLITFLRNKGFNGTITEATAFLEKLNMPVTGITDVKQWLDMLENCR